MEYNTLVHPAGRVLRARFRGRNRQFGDISTIIHNSTRTFHCQAFQPGRFPGKRPFFDPFCGVLRTFYISSPAPPRLARQRSGFHSGFTHESNYVIAISVLQDFHSFSQGFDLPQRMDLREESARFFFMERKKAPDAPCAGQRDSPDDSPHRRVDFFSQWTRDRPLAHCARRAA